MRTISPEDLAQYGALPQEGPRVDFLLRSGISPNRIRTILDKDRALNDLMGPVWARRQQLLYKDGVAPEEAENIIHGEFPNLKEALKNIKTAA